MTNSVDPVQTAPIEQSNLGPPCLLLYLNKSVMLGNYLQQTTSADAFFSWRFRGLRPVGSNYRLGGGTHKFFYRLGGGGGGHTYFFLK